MSIEFVWILDFKYILLLLLLLLLLDLLYILDMYEEMKLQSIERLNILQI